MKSPFPATLIAARHKAALTQTQAAKIVGVTLRTWQNWEDGTHPMRPTMFDYFCKRMGVTP